MTKIIQRHDTAANWTTANPVLAAGEMGVETDTNKFKFGDGVTAWSELAYATSGSSGGGTQLTSFDGEISYSTLALGDNLVVDTGDIAWTNPQMSSNSQDGYVVSASITSSSSGAVPWKAFDKDTTTSENAYYTGSVSMPQWIRLECPKPVRLTSCMIMNELSSPANFKSGIIQGSNDGNSFDDLYTITDRPNTTGLRVTYSIDTTKYYKYLRVYFTSTYGSIGVSIQEIEFKGFVKDEIAEPSLNVNSNTVSGLSMPSDNYIDLTLGETNSTYTAPANGWYNIVKTANASDQFLTIKNATTMFGVGGQKSLNNGAIHCYILPAKKNDVIQVRYNFGGATNIFRFYYAEGEV